MTIARPVLHSADAGLDWAARNLILEKLGEQAETALSRFVSDQAMLNVQELDRKLSTAYGWRPEQGWLVRSEAMLLEITRVKGVPREAIGEPIGPLQNMAWNAFVTMHTGQARLLALPEPEFLAVLELSLRAQLRVDRGVQSTWRVREMALIFQRRQLPYEVADDGDISWVGDPQIAATAVTPALAALADERLANAREEFSEARAELRAGRFDDAANDAGKAVETTMACLLVARGHEVPRNRAGQKMMHATQLLDALKQHSLVEARRSEKLLLAAQGFRDAASHGAGPAPIPVERPDAEAALASAAVAITYLAAHLPPVDGVAARSGS